MNNVFLYRMPVGIAGAVSRPQDLTVEPVVLKSDNAFAAYGLAGKYDDDGFFVPLADGDTADKVKGIYVRPYPTTSQPDMVRRVGSGKNFPGDAMKRGYVTVNLGSDFDASTIKKATRYTLSSPLMNPSKCRWVDSWPRQSVAKTWC